ncbi:phosphatidylinositol phosphate synthase [Natronoglycomyces albus]|uniref:CDP-alcohol phosphatidyltransferase family protein n=1 Tax=Natronoglycomyces albus TaxID=2811108 RepID=A0A895XR19_9ACTN|nr:CDP-alcohol phosphatidyltransferase family protein [Natronoglycomyces albus]QSB04028.1 CDP-alcohol phosphatidyltransferase family protein [Natronoglycomyces albus]
MAKFLRTQGRSWLRIFLDSIARRCVALGISANAVTLACTFVVVTASVVLIPQGYWVWAFFILLVACLGDILDGSIARIQGGGSKFGALLDSVCDRIADGAILGAVAFWFALQDRYIEMAVALACLVTSEVVSYVKARAEGLGATCDVGYVERLERLILIGLAGLLEIFGVPFGMLIVLSLLAALSFATIVQRLLHTRDQLRN